MISTALYALKANTPTILRSNVNVCLYPCWSNTPSSCTPLVLLGGTASVIDSWQAHVKPLSRERDVLCVEGLGQGKSTALDCSMTSQVSAIHSALHEDLGVREVDVAGVSFGGRVGVALARDGGSGGGRGRTRVRKLHVTGIGAKRDEQAVSRIERWRELLSDKEKGLEMCAWDLVKSSYSKGFLKKNEKKLGKFVEFVVNKNTREGLERLIGQSHAAIDDALGVRESLRLTGAREIRFLLGSEDVVVAKDAKGVKVAMDELIDEVGEGGGGRGEGMVVEGYGHVLNMEWGGWSRDLEDFLKR
ncbi:hypothetical protein TrCOL_g2307 [Triparma columacea]|uniref:AB hydrolase-1 domain-containing protein n=1 Tax=Triparma columacea TaxID=722753 RepID=A0A9W7G0Y9_9STRA|nr:hypothetical protein TrCOL_g2307 [Triparma columacea]